MEAKASAAIPFVQGLRKTVAWPGKACFNP